MEAATDHFRTERVWCSLSFSGDLKLYANPIKALDPCRKAGSQECMACVLSVSTATGET